jgi:hypothetical protein
MADLDLASHVPNPMPAKLLAEVRRLLAGEKASACKRCLDSGRTLCRL